MALSSSHLSYPLVLRHALCSLRAGKDGFFAREMEQSSSRQMVSAHVPWIQGFKKQSARFAGWCTH